MRFTVLTIDDSKTVRTIVRKAFKPFACSVLEAANGREGLALAAMEKPDLILLDVTMPVMDGIEMLTQLKADAVLRLIPVIMLTAESSRDQAAAIATLGVRDTLAKPFKEALLIEKCSRIIGLTQAPAASMRVTPILDHAGLSMETKPASIRS